MTLSRVCDFKADCSDSSDEEHCGMHLTVCLSVYQLFKRSFDFWERKCYFEQESIKMVKGDSKHIYIFTKCFYLK